MALETKWTQMTNSQINLNYCAECHQIDKENVSNCRWLNHRFCGLKCLKQFQSKIALECDLCKEYFKCQRIHLRDDVKISDSLKFICDECFRGREKLAVSCSRCSTVCYKECGAQNLTTSGLIPKYVCSNSCEKPNEVPWSGLVAATKCVKCEFRGKCLKIVYNGQTHGFCSTLCLMQFELDSGIKFETCERCSTRYTNDQSSLPVPSHVIIDESARKVFCSDNCMNWHMRDDPTAVICCYCRHRMQFFSCIRRSGDNRCFCSVKCASAAETSIELLRHNDEWSPSKDSAIQPELKFDDSDQDYCLSNQSTLTASDPVSKQTNVAAMSVFTGNVKPITSQCQFVDDDLDGLKMAPKLKEPDHSMYCSKCERDIKRERPFFQWEFLTFCDAFCYESCMYSGSYSCSLCAQDCDSNYAIHAHIIGERLGHFCSDACERSFFDLMKFCKFCRDISNSTNINGFCSLDCQMRYRKLYGSQTDATKFCYQCNSQTTCNISLCVDGDAYQFCSFACYFHLKTSNGLMPDQCTICQLNFVRDSNEDANIMLLHNRKLKLFCSKACRAHFIYKYRVLEMCSVCCRRKSNFNMVKSVAGDMSIEVNYCSMQCWQIVDQSIELENALKFISPV